MVENTANSYKSVINFINFVNYNIVEKIKKLYLITELKKITIDKIIDDNKIEYNKFLDIIKDFDINFNKMLYLPLNPDNPSESLIIDKINLYEFFNFNTYYNALIITDIVDIDKLKNLIDKYINLSIIIKKEIFNIYNEYKNLLKIVDRKFIKFAWVEKIGHQIIENIQLYIGGNYIDSIDSVKTDIDYQLLTKFFKDKNYNQLILNIKILNEFNS